MLAAESISNLTRAWINVDQVKLEMCIDKIYSALTSGRLVLTAGNGGSASTASHFVNDWAKGLRERTNSPIRAICLSDNTATLTALANDVSYDQIFASQLENYVGLKPILICISGSGNSANILNAAKQAKTLGIEVVGLIGFDGGKLTELCTTYFHCDINDMQIVEDIHLSFGHMVLRRFQ